MERNPSEQKKSELYKKIKNHIEKTGFIINPLLVVKDNDKYKVVYGNNRYLAGIELGYNEFSIEVLKKAGYTPTSALFLVELDFLNPKLDVPHRSVIHYE